MAKKKGTGVSPITNRIYYGTQDTEKHMWIGQKTDITDGLPKNCSIEKNDFELVYLKFEWIGNTYYPQESDKSEGQPIRVYKIKM